MALDPLSRASTQSEARTPTEEAVFEVVLRQPIRARQGVRSRRSGHCEGRKVAGARGEGRHGWGDHARCAPGHGERLLKPLHEARVPPRGPPSSCLFVHFPLIWISRFIFELYGCRQIWIISFNPNLLTLFWWFIFQTNHAEKCIYHFLQENNQSIISFLLYQLYYQIDIEILFDLQLLLEGWTLSNRQALEAMTNSTNIGVGATIFQELSWRLLDLTCTTLINTRFRWSHI